MKLIQIFYVSNIISFSQVFLTSRKLLYVYYVYYSVHILSSIKIKIFRLSEFPYKIYKIYDI